jgi:hypothetical protein
MHHACWRSPHRSTLLRVLLMVVLLPAAARRAEAQAASRAAVVEPPTLVTVTQPPGSGGERQCAVTAAGQVACLAYDGSAPKRVPGLDGVVALVTAGRRDFNCALDRQGAVHCWGADPCHDAGKGGLFGGGRQAAHDRPVPFTAVTGAVEHLRGSGQQLCLKPRHGALRCWSLGGTGCHPPEVVPPAIVTSTAGGHGQCRLAVNGRLTCKLYSVNDADTKTYRVDLPGPYRTVRGMGDEEICAIDRRGVVSCCHNLDCTRGPWPRVRLPGPATQLASDGLLSCAVLDDGSIQCWAGNTEPPTAHSRGYPVDLPDRQRNASPGPEIRGAPVKGLPGPADSLAIGQGYLCARRRSGELVCLGEGFTDPRSALKNPLDL